MTNVTNAKYRPLLLKLYHVGLQAVSGYDCVRDYFVKNQLQRNPCSVIAVGKAALSMAQATEHYFSNSIRTGLLITRFGYAAGNNLPENWHVVEAAHPVPDASSLTAGKLLIEFIKNLAPNEDVYILLSGGASALVEHLPDTISLDSLQAVTKWMLANGQSIHEINRMRQCISCLKGGGALGYLPLEVETKNVTQLIISDVQNDDVTVIGSALFTPVNVQLNEVKQQIPTRFYALFEQQNVHAKKRDAVKTEIVANNTACRTSIENEAIKSGFPVFNHTELLTGDVVTVAERIVDTISKGEPGIYIWGGEPTVMLPDSPGMGGRSQHLALLLADRISGDSRYIILCAGTDGSDGTTAAAGGLVDSDTVLRGQSLGLDVHRALINADSGRYLEETGDLVDTGPTGTNVMDIVIILKIDRDPELSN